LGQTFDLSQAVKEKQEPVKEIGPHLKHWKQKTAKKKKKKKKEMEKVVLLCKGAEGPAP